MANAEFALEVTTDPAHYGTWSLSAAGRIITGFSVRLLGWAATETSGSAAATVNVYDGTDTTGLIVLPIRLAQSEAGESWYGPNGIWFKNGVYINVASGQAQGAIFYRHVRL